VGQHPRNRLLCGILWATAVADSMSLLSAPSPTEQQFEFAVRSNASQRIIAAGIVIAFCYWAASVVMTLLLSILLAYFLDPLVELLERFNMPRVLGALIAVLLTVALLAGFGALLWSRAESFAEAWPTYEAPLRAAAQSLEQKIQRLERRFSAISATPAAGEKPSPAVRLEEPGPVRGFLIRMVGSLYNFLLAGTFVPFLVFFMLAARRDVWHGTMQLFHPTERTRVKQTLEDISTMLRSYVVGNALVALILVVSTTIFFMIIGLDYPWLVGIASGLLNMIPYMGAALSLLPPLVIGLASYHSITPFLGIAAVLGFFHLIASNVLVPALVGKKVHLNALAVTIALLFWGWMWGALGFILGIPITATIKVICDRVDRWQPIGRWLGS
jgi:predicted PurR-regulated permease PerM